MFFLICAIIGGIVLSSAYANIGRLTHMRDEQQAYLTASSATKLLRDELESFVFTAVHVKVSGDGTEKNSTNFAISPESGSLSTKLIDSAKSTFSSLTAAPVSFSIESDIGTVDVNMTMDPGYNISAVLTISGQDAYKMTLLLEADVNESTVTSSRDCYKDVLVPGEDGEPDKIVSEFDYTEITETTTTIVSWPDGIISKGG